MAYDILIHNGTVIDGTGAPGRRVDVGVVGERIVAVGDLAGRSANQTIDASDRVVCPGFIDIHQHSDFTPLVNRACESAVHQGITTAVIGNCGHGCAPMTDPDLVRMVVIGYQPEFGVPLDWTSFGEYMQRLATPGVSVNLAPLVAHGAVRLAVMGLEGRAASPAELARMKDYVLEAMEAGAFGISTGLEYSPGRHADQYELTELTKIVAPFGGIYASHIRNRGFTFVEATAEALAIGADAGVPVQLAHFAPRPYALAGTFERCLELVYAAVERGQRVAMDTFPDIFGPGPVAALLPPWIYEGRPIEGLAKLQDTEVREAIRESFENPTNYLLRVDGLGGLVLTYAKGNPELVGKSFDIIANLRGQAAHDAICDLLLAEGEDFYTSLLRHIYATADDLKALMRQPICAMESDGVIAAPYGPLADFTMNPSSYGYTAKVLGQHVRDEGFYTLEDAIWRMTGLPAEAANLRDRGVIREGLAADLVVFDPTTVQDNTTNDFPNRYPSGIDYVIVNGAVTLTPTGHTGVLGGQVLTRP